jgi:hypothetical protein
MLYNAGMVERHVRRAGIDRTPSGDRCATSGRVNLDYWLSRPTEERLSAVEFLRRQYYGRGAAGLRRVVSVLKRP